MAEVFISYAREDQGFARDLNATLQKLQRDTWIDWRSIPDSAQWRAEIFAAIEAADNFLFIISPDSVRSWMSRTLDRPHRTIDGPQVMDELLSRALDRIRCLTAV